jgi:hypothetical protein
MQSIDVVWDGSYKLDELSLLNDNTLDYGVYSIYGHHPIYGSDVLIYIGKAVQQTFFTRITQEAWHLNLDSKNVKVYIGRLCGDESPSDEEWNYQISAVEMLLIYAHSPACNSQFINSLREDDISNIHVFNWGNHRSLMSEVSGRRWSGIIDKMPYRYNG